MMRRTCFFLLLLFFLFLTPRAFASVEDDINNQINEIKTLLEGSRNATKPLEETLGKVEAEFALVEKNIKSVELDIGIKQKEITDGEKKLGEEKDVFDIRVRSYYKNSRHFLGNSIGYFIGNNVDEAVRKYFYQQRIVQKDRDAILKTAFFITKLEEKKSALQQEQSSLAEAKKQLDEQKKFYETEVGKAKNYQKGLEKQIAELTVRQQQIVSQRLTSLNIPRSAGTSVRGCSDDRGIDPGFGPRFAFFTYGAPHRNGLNQYGAFGRAKAGQNEEQILQEYYPGLSLKKDYDQGTQMITTTGWSGTIEEYVKRIYEVPNSWGDQGGMAALKAQAVAARTYALNSMQRNGSICTTESCQVFKIDPKGGNWEQAVNETAGWVLMDGGNPGFTQYASTHGGYILNIGKFDGINGNPGTFGELNERAYDKESPWFYCDWGARGEFAYTAWLKPVEVADIVNATLLLRVDSSTSDHLYQVDKPHPYGGEVWSGDRVKQELRNRNISPLETVSEVLISADFSSGKTTGVTISGHSFTGDEFKNLFNLRAPANIQIVGPLYNVEKR